MCCISLKKNFFFIIVFSFRFSWFAMVFVRMTFVNKIVPSSCFVMDGNRRRKAKKIVWRSSDYITQYYIHSEISFIMVEKTTKKKVDIIENRETVKRKITAIEHTRWKRTKIRERKTIHTNVLYKIGK